MKKISLACFWSENVPFHYRKKSLKDSDYIYTSRMEYDIWQLTDVSRVSVFPHVFNLKSPTKICPYFSLHCHEGKLRLVFFFWTRGLNPGHWSCFTLQCLYSNCMEIILLHCIISRAPRTRFTSRATLLTILLREVTRDYAMMQYNGNHITTLA